MKMPETKALDIAISWLRSNEGIEGESDACELVAAWIEHEERERYIRRAAREGRCPVARLRRKLQESA
jgi:hypothetical protein